MPSRPALPCPSDGANFGSPRCLTGISDPVATYFESGQRNVPIGQEMSAPAAKVEHETEHQARERNPSASSPRGGEPGEPGRHRPAAGQHRAGAGDAAVRDGLPGRRRRDRDGRGDPGAVPAGAGAGLLGGDGGADLDPGRVHLRAGLLRRCGLQPAGVADPPDPCDQGRRRRVHRLGPPRCRASAGRRGAGRRGGAGVGRAGHLRVDRQAAARTASRTRTRSCSGRRRAARMWRTWPGWPGRSTPAPSPQDNGQGGKEERRSGSGRCGWRPRSAAPGS